MMKILILSILFLVYPIMAQDLQRNISITPTLLLESDYRHYPNEVEGQNGFALARLRPGILLRPTNQTKAVVSTELVGKAQMILDAYMRHQFSSELEMTVGYSKPPMFASFVYEPVYQMAFPDRAPVVMSFRIQRDAGIDLHWQPKNLPLETWLRIGNGTGSPLGNDQSSPAFYFYMDYVMGRAHFHQKKEIDGFGLRMGMSAMYEKTADRDGIIGQTPLNFVFFRPVIVSGVRSVFEAHLVIYLKSLRWITEFAYANESRTKDDDGNINTPRVSLSDMVSFGLSSELTWMLVGQPRQVGKVLMVDAQKEQNIGQWEAGIRYDRLDLGKNANDVKDGGSEGGSILLKWFWANYISVSLDLYYMRYVFAPIEEERTLSSLGFWVRNSIYWGF
jgi:phosphate-selective porin OprO/OprP